MNISNIFNILSSFSILAIIVILVIMDRSRQKQIDKLRDDFKSVLSLVDSLRFRVLDHERQLLDKDGVFVPEDTGIFAFNLMWSILDEDTKKSLESEYRQVCPEHIPLWKYVIYSYKFSPKVERKIELRKIETVEDLINGELKSISNEVKKVREEMNKNKEAERNISSKLKEIESKKQKI